MIMMTTEIMIMKMINTVIMMMIMITMTIEIMIMRRMMMITSEIGVRREVLATAGGFPPLVRPAHPTV